MSPTVSFVTTLLAAGTVILNLFFVFAVVSFFRPNSLSRFFAQRALLFSFLIALTGTLTSLFYSEVAGFLPCVLCWWQRIFLYSQVVVLGLALRYHDYFARQYAIALSSLGGLVALYHVYIQAGGTELIPCDASGVSCGQVFFQEFGYVTIPVMALSGFLAILALSILSKKYEG